MIASYRGTDGEQHYASDATREALLAAMGIDASTEVVAASLLDERRRAATSRLLEPIRVVRRGDSDERALVVNPPTSGSFDWRVEMATEAGREVAAEGHVDASGAATIPLPQIDEDGFHRLRLRLRTGGGEWTGEQTFVVAPASCVTVRERLGAERGYGISANLYSVRAGGAPIGDLSTLARLVRWAGREGAAFVGVNPLSAIRGLGGEISPYSPTTRVFRSFLYLDLDAIPESRVLERSRGSAEPFAPSPTKGRKPPFALSLSKGHPSDEVLPPGSAESRLLDYEAITTAKLGALRRLHRVFARIHGGAKTARGRAYVSFVAAGGDMLRGFATFCALDEHFGTARGGTAGWRQWPEAYRDPGGEAVARFAREQAAEIDFQSWVQFEIDRQLEKVARTAARSGVALGVYQDLPIGAVPSGCEEWLLRGLFCAGASVGAPPDAFFAGGQNWGLAPLQPHVLRAQGYGYWTTLLRAAFAHAGALRVDHIMGLVRQYWIPQGMSARDGAYVRMPADELFGILALESRRAGAVVIGEDLGTVPDEIPALLHRWGVLSSRVLYFERTEGGGYRAAADYPQACFVSANTHDLATLAGYEAKRDLDLSASAGVLADAEWVANARRERERDTAKLREMTAAGQGEPLTRPVYTYLAQTPSALLGVALDDLGGEVDPVNLPGVAGDVYPSWRRRMRGAVQEIARDPQVKATLAAIRRERP